MSKYQEVMEHVKVDDEMKKRILLNVSKELEDSNKQIKAKPKAKILAFQRYAAIAASLAVLLVGSYAVLQATGDIRNTAETASMSAEPAMEEAASMSEAPAMEAETAVTESAADEAAPSEASSFGESVVTHVPLPESDKSESITLGGESYSSQHSINESEPGSTPYVIESPSAHASPKPIVLPYVVLAVLGLACLALVSGIIALIIIFVRKKKR